MSLGKSTYAKLDGASLSVIYIVRFGCPEIPSPVVEIFDGARRLLMF